MWFPLIGAAVGAWGAAWHAAAALLWPAPAALAPALSTLATVWLTGCFHEDGLADTMDGFGGGWGRQQILRWVGRLGCWGTSGRERGAGCMAVWGVVTTCTAPALHRHTAG